jgi:hypothetical protein
MASNPVELLSEIKQGWQSQRPDDRLRAIVRIGELADSGIELQKAEVVPILREAMYQDYRPYPGEIWVIGLVTANKVCEAFGYDFNIFNVSDNHQPPPA